MPAARLCELPHGRLRETAPSCCLGDLARRACEVDGAANGSTYAGNPAGSSPP